jgi:AGZA family xanthine/uracil permease-like MFS transporter
VITYVESAVGIGMGVRTGLAAVTCGLLMLTCFLVAPFLHLIPVAATTGALIFVGIKLCPPKAQLRGLDWLDLAVLVIMPIVVIATFAIDRAMLAGFAIYLVVGLIRRHRPDPFLLGSTVLMAISTVLQFR